MLEASSSLGSTRLIATRAYQSSDLKPAQRARKARTTPGPLHAETASVVIRVWTLCIIRSVPEQRQTVVAALIWFDAAQHLRLPLPQQEISIRGSSVSLVLAVGMDGLLHALH